jgi:dolichol kinase
MSRGYNWRNTLADFASVSGALAGFCVAFIGLILGWSIADIRIYQQLTFGNVAVLFFGIATSLFITASEYFLHSKNFDVFDIKEEQRKWLESGFPEKNWEEIWKESTKMMRVKESYGRWCYNSAIFIMFIGLFFAIAPYNTAIAFIVSIIGIVLELWQFKGEMINKLKRRKRKV